MFCSYCTGLNIRKKKLFFLYSRERYNYTWGNATNIIFFPSENNNKISFFTYLRFRLKKCLQYYQQRKLRYYATTTTTPIYIKVQQFSWILYSSFHCTIWSLRMEDMHATLNFLCSINVFIFGGGDGLSDF